MADPDGPARPEQGDTGFAEGQKARPDDERVGQFSDGNEALPDDTREGSFADSVKPPED